MIKYQLTCDQGHEFNAWFRDGAAYDRQEQRRQVGCPACGSHHVRKAPMAPSVARRSRPEPERLRVMVPMGETQSELIRAMREIRRELMANAEYVGPQFAEEARKIHFEETEARGIYGEASAQEVRELADEGITVVPLPRVPEDYN